jgi:ParB/RepB/Spo0J family partition protein
VTKSVDIKLDEIAIPPNRSRALQSAKVDEIAESIKAIGQLQNITLRRIQTRAPGHRYELIAGQHRLEAARKLGWATIRCIVLDEGTSDEEAELIEIDENLKRAELSAAELSIVLARRKALYEKRFPEAQHGGARSPGESMTEGFTKATAKATGKGRSTIAKSVTRAKKLGTKLLADAKGTSLDAADELDALAKLQPEKRREIVDDAKAGKKVSAKALVKAAKTAPAPAPKDEKAAAEEAAERWRHSAGFHADELRKVLPDWA